MNREMPVLAVSQYFYERTMYVKSLRLRRIKAVLAACAMTCTACFSNAMTLCTHATVDNATAKQYTDSLVSFLNNERVKLGLPEYVILPDLVNGAGIRAQEISVSYGHMRPDGRLPSSAIGNYGGMQEALYAGGSAASVVVSAWLSSPDHEPILTSKNNTHIGVGYYLDDKGVSYWVLIAVGSYANGEKAYHEGQYIPNRVLGDADGSQVISANDASMILAYSAAKAANVDYPVVSSFKDATDINKDGSIDSIDASIVLSYTSARGVGQNVKLEDFVH